MLLRIYKLLKLVLVPSLQLLVLIESFASSMNYVKDNLRTKMENQYIDECLVAFIKRELLFQVKGSDTSGASKLLPLFRNGLSFFHRGSTKEHKVKVRL